MGIFDAAAPNYGDLPKDVDVLRRSCPVVASYGGKDRMLPGAAGKLQAVLAEGGVPHDVKEHPNVGHSFMNEFPTPSVLQFVERAAGFAFSESEAEDAWAGILAFFGEHLS
jgi:carboxymethylenebutenolidase